MAAPEMSKRGLLLESDFWQTEKDAPVLNLDKGYLQSQKPTSYKTLVDRGNRWLQNANVTQQSISTVKRDFEHWLQSHHAETPERIFVKDAERTFKLLTHQKLLIQMLGFLKAKFGGDYHQGLSLAAGFLLLVLDTPSVLALLIQFNTQDRYVPDVWKAEAIKSATDAYVFLGIVKEVYPDVHAHMAKHHVMPEMFMQKYICALCVHVLPFEPLFAFFDLFTMEGFTAIFKVALSIVKLTAPAILKADSSDIILALLRLDDKACPSQITIPLCNEVVKHAQATTAKEFPQPKNWANAREQAFVTHLKKRMEQAKQSHAEDQAKLVPCSLCKKEIAEWYCEECNVDACEACLNKYPSHDDSEHTIINIDEKEQDEEEQPPANLKDMSLGYVEKTVEENHEFAKGFSWDLNEQKNYNFNKTFNPFKKAVAALAEDNGQNGDEDGGDVEGECAAEYVPVVSLKPVEVDNGERDDSPLWKGTCVLFRFDPAEKAWKERGRGEAKLLENNKSLCRRLVLRENQTRKLRMNHNVNHEVELKANEGSDKAWTWATLDFSESPEGQMETFAIRFKTKELAEEFRAEYEKARVHMHELSSGKRPTAAQPATNGTEKDGQKAKAKENGNKTGDKSSNKTGTKAETNPETKPETKTETQTTEPKPNVKTELKPEPKTATKPSKEEQKADIPVFGSLPAPSFSFSLPTDGSAFSFAPSGDVQAPSFSFASLPASTTTSSTSQFPFTNGLPSGGLFGTSNSNTTAFGSTSSGSLASGSTDAFNFGSASGSANAFSTSSTSAFSPSSISSFSPISSSAFPSSSASVFGSGSADAFSSGSASAHGGSTSASAFGPGSGAFGSFGSNSTGASVSGPFTFSSASVSDSSSSSSAFNPPAFGSTFASSSGPNAGSFGSFNAGSSPAFSFNSPSTSTASISGFGSAPLLPNPAGAAPFTFNFAGGSGGTGASGDAFALGNLGQALSATTNTAPEEDITLCDTCSSCEASVFCQECEITLCDICLRECPSSHQHYPLPSSAQPVMKQPGPQPSQLGTQFVASKGEDPVLEYGYEDGEYEGDYGEGDEGDYEQEAEEVKPAEAQAKPGQVNALSKFADLGNKWTCPTCDLPNKESDLKCIACETPNPTKSVEPIGTSAPTSVGGGAFSLPTGMTFKPSMSFGDSSFSFSTGGDSQGTGTAAPMSAFAFSTSSATSTFAFSTTTATSTFPSPATGAFAFSTSSSSAPGSFAFSMSSTAPSTSFAAPTAATSSSFPPGEFSFSGPISNSAPSIGLTAAVGVNPNSADHSGKGGASSLKGSNKGVATPVKGIEHTDYALGDVLSSGAPLSKGGSPGAVDFNAKKAVSSPIPVKPTASLNESKLVMEHLEKLLALMTKVDKLSFVGPASDSLSKLRHQVDPILSDEHAFEESKRRTELAFRDFKLSPKGMKAANDYLSFFAVARSEADYRINSILLLLPGYFGKTAQDVRTAFYVMYRDQRNGKPLTSGQEFLRLTNHTPLAVQVHSFLQSKTK